MLDADEREEAKRMMPHIPGGGVLLFDRGYPSYDLISFLSINYSVIHFSDARLKAHFLPLKILFAPIRMRV